MKKVDGETVTTVTTDENGEVLLAHLDPAVYEIIEKSVPNDYLLDTTPQFITLTPNKTGTVNFKNYPKPTLTINKVDSVTGLPLKGAKFSVVYASNITFTGEINDLGIFHTDENGKIVITHRIDGWYKLTELEPPENYVLKEPIIQEFFIKAGENKTVTFENTKKPNLTVHKVDAITKDPIKNAKFTIWRAKNNSLDGELIKVGNFISDENGKIILENQEVGWYRIKETEPAYGYSIKSPDTQDIFLEAGKDKEITFENQPKNAIIIRKIDAQTGEMIPNTKFLIRHASNGSSGTSGTIIGEYITSHNGTIVVTGLKSGAYIVEEQKAADGYIMVENAPQTVWLQEGETSVVEVTFANAKESGLIIKKMDAETKEPLSDVIFKVTDSSGGAIGTSNGEFRTNENGLIHIPNLKPDTYVVQELQTKKGYILDDTTQTIKTEFGKLHTLEFYNRRLSGLLIKKLDVVSKKPLANAVFTVTTSDGKVIGENNGEFTTDKDGIIYITDIEPTTVVVKESVAPTGFIIDTTPQTVKIEVGKTHTLEFLNAPLAGLQIHKTDARTGEPLKGVKFRVTKMNGQFVGDYTTGSGGIAFVGELPPDWYTVFETKCLDGYVLDATPQNVEMKTGKGVVLEFENTPLSTLQIKKLDETTGEPIQNTVFRVEKINGEYVGSYTTGRNGIAYVDELEKGYYSVYETRAASGYVLNKTPQTIEIKKGKLSTLTFYNTKYPTLVIRKYNDKTGNTLAGAEFSVYDTNGRIYKIYETDVNGQIRITSLREGDYIVKETKAPKGFSLDEKAYNVSLEWGKTTTLDVYNKPMASILIKKIDANTKKGIYGTTFLLYDPDNNPYGEYTTDQDGYVHINGELREGKYKVREIKASEGYNLDTEIKTLWVTAGKTSEIYWENTSVKGQLIITKRSSQYNEMTLLPAGSVLSGAVFEVYDRVGNLVDKMISDSRGIAASKPLNPSVYTIKEVSAPKFYVLNNRELFAEIRHDGDIVRFDVLNDSVWLATSISKKGHQQSIAGQQIRYDLYDIANNSTVPLENFYVHDRLPTDAVRGTKLFTGTYNQRLTYKVSYKTNYNDYRILASNLSSQLNYELSLQSNVLGLSDGEVVTDIRFEFGTVMAGFKNNDNPFMFCDVLPSLPTGYNIVNRADIGGQYLGEWVLNKASWVTIIQQGFEPKPLPKTGY